MYGLSTFSVRNVTSRSRGCEVVSLLILHITMWDRTIPIYYQWSRFHIITSEAEQSGHDCSNNEQPGQGDHGWAATQLRLNMTTTRSRRVEEVIEAGRLLLWPGKLQWRSALSGNRMLLKENRQSYIHRARQLLGLQTTEQSSPYTYQCQCFPSIYFAV